MGREAIPAHLRFLPLNSNLTPNIHLNLKLLALIKKIKTYNAYLFNGKTS